jgi:hypothetical protein
MTFCTGKLIKNLHWPVPNKTIIYWQPVCLCTGTVPNQFETYRQDILYWHAYQELAFGGTKWQGMCFNDTGTQHNLKH